MKAKLILETLTVVLLVVLIWMTWPVNRAALRQPIKPVMSGVTLEWTVTRPDREPVKISHQLEVGETRERWEPKIRELIEGVRAFKE